MFASLATLSNTYLVRRGVRLLVVRPSRMVVPTVPSGDANTIHRRPLIDDTTGKRRSRRSRHCEDSMMAEELEGSNGVRLRRLIRSYRSQDPFPRKPSITVSVILHVTTFVIQLPSCFMITKYHNIITPHAQPMLYSFPCIHSPLCFTYSFRLTRLANPALVTSVLTNRMQYRLHGSP